MTTKPNANVAHCPAHCGHCNPTYATLYLPDRKRGMTMPTSDTDAEIDPYNPNQPRINTPCPACGMKTLFIGAGGLLTCSVVDCPEADTEAAIKALVARREVAAVLSELRYLRPTGDGLLASIIDLRIQEMEQTELQQPRPEGDEDGNQ